MREASTGMVRPAGPDDAPALAELERRCFSDAWSEGSLRSGMAGTGACYFLYEEAGLILGYCGAQVVLDEGELLRIVVGEENRGRGIGSRLLGKLMEKFPEVCAWYLEVRMGNLPAVALYRKFGFLPVGQRKNYYRNPQEDALLMRREKEE